MTIDEIKEILEKINFPQKYPYTKDILMRLSVDKVADDMAYDEIIDQIKSLEPLAKV